MTVPSYSLSNYICKAFALLDYFNNIIKKSDIPAQSACEYTLINMLDSYHSISCLNHERKIQWFVKQVISNIFLNNRRKLSTDYLSWYYKLLQKKRLRKIIIKLRKGTSIFLKIFIRLCSIHFLQSFFEKKLAFFFFKKYAAYQAV